MLYAFFWAIPRRLNFIRRRFGTLRLLHLNWQVPAYEDGTDRVVPAYEDGTDGVFRNVGI